MDRTGEKYDIGVAPANGLSGHLPFSQTEDVLLSLAKIVEQRDMHTAGHCERLAVTGVALGIAMQLEQSSLLALYLAGFLHDVGKIGIPDSVLFKADRLNETEWEIMRSHSVRGEEICRPLHSLACVLPIIRHHHERWNGTGYPDGLVGSATPLLARVLQIADIYDALTNPRPYKSAFTAARALEVLEEEMACGWRDPEITALFLRLHRPMLSKIADFCPDTSTNVASMRKSLSHLQDFLKY